MSDPRFDNTLRIIQSLVGLVLILIAVLFLWRGVTATGSVGVDFPFFSGHIDTTSAGLAILFVGTIILIFSRRGNADVVQSSDKALSVIIIGIVFYVIIGFLPTIFYISLAAYLHAYYPDNVKSTIPGLGMFILIIQVPLILWIVDEVKKLIGVGPKK